MHARVREKEILKGIDLTINTGEIHAIMGPNGSGKSTLAQVLSGRDLYVVTEGEVILDGKNLQLEMSPEDRAREGVFMAFQYPVEIPGVSNLYFLKTALNTIRKGRGLPDLDAMDFLALVKEKMRLMEMDQALMNRSVNAGLSGGEKKRNEIFQMAVLEPRLAILDETDSGLDIDALKIVANGVNALRSPDQIHDPGDALPAAARLHRSRPRARACRVDASSNPVERILPSNWNSRVMPASSWRQPMPDNLTVSELEAPYIAQFRKSSNHGTGRLRELRETAIDRFAELGFPTTRDEDWKFTNHGAVNTDSFRGRAGRRANPEDAARLLSATAAR